MDHGLIHVLFTPKKISYEWRLHCFPNVLDFPTYENWTLQNPHQSLWEGHIQIGNMPTYPRFLQCFALVLRPPDRQIMGGFYEILKGHRQPVSFARLCCCYYPGNRIGRFTSETSREEELLRIRCSIFFLIQTPSSFRSIILRLK